jgi:hypothetical protein
VPLARKQYFVPIQLLLAEVACNPFTVCAIALGFTSPGIISYAQAAITMGIDPRMNTKMMGDREMQCAVGHMLSEKLVGSVSGSRR